MELKDKLRLLREILLKNNVVFKDRPLNKKAKEGLINFLENFMEG